MIKLLVILFLVMGCDDRRHGNVVVVETSENTWTFNQPGEPHRYENKEVICYVLNGGLSCTWKQQ